MNCKPGQLAYIAKPMSVHKCIGMRIGTPVRTVRLAQPTSELAAALLTITGPVWMVENTIQCPSGRSTCPGLQFIPDACLRPFEPDSKPEAIERDTSTPVEALRS